MTQTIVIPKLRRNSLGQLKGEFYPLQKAELLALRKTEPINNAAFVYLALRLENPQGDRSVSIKIKKFALRWGILESSIHETLTKINRAGGDYGYGKQRKRSFKGLQRFDSHFNQLKKACHPSRQLQDDWKSYGPENFVFEVLEVISVYTQGSAALVWGSNAALRQLGGKWHKNFENTYSRSSWDSCSKNFQNLLAIKFRHHIEIEAGE